MRDVIIDTGRYNAEVTLTGRFSANIMISRINYSTKLKKELPGGIIGNGDSVYWSVFAFRNVEEKAKKKAEKIIEKIKKKQNKKVINYTI